MSMGFKIWAEKVLVRGEKCRKIKKFEMTERRELPKEYASGYPAVFVDPGIHPCLTLNVSGELAWRVRQMGVMKGRYKTYKGQGPERIYVNILQVTEGESIPEEEFQVFISHLAEAISRLKKINEKIAQRAETWKGTDVFVF